MRDVSYEMNEQRSSEILRCFTPAHAASSREYLVTQSVTQTSNANINFSLKKQFLHYIQQTDFISTKPLTCILPISTVMTNV